jgi:hypothetical protein
MKRRVVLVLGVLVLSYLLAGSNFSRRMERIGEQIGWSGTTTDKVAIVSITDDDYQSLFDATSPLNHCVLEKLIDKIAKTGPAVIGVDIDTSASQFLPSKIDPSWPPTVWEEDVNELSPPVSDSVLQPKEILGGKKGLGPQNTIGLGLLIDDAEDSVTRRYRPWISTVYGTLPSFPRAVVMAYKKAIGESISEDANSKEELRIDYRGDADGSHRLNISASKLLSKSEANCCLEQASIPPQCSIPSSASQPSPPPKDRPQDLPFLKGKIVLLGGSFLDQDRHDTPLGRKLRGVEVLANAVETDLGLPDKRWRLSLACLEAFEATCLVIIFHAKKFTIWKKVAYASGLVIVLSGVYGYFAFGTPGGFLFLVIFQIGVLLIEVLQHCRFKLAKDFWPNPAKGAHLKAD